MEDTFQCFCPPPLLALIPLQPFQPSFYSFPCLPPAPPPSYNPKSQPGSKSPPWPLWVLLWVSSPSWQPVLELGCSLDKQAIRLEIVIMLVIFITTL